MSAHLEGAEDGHESGPGLGPLLGGVANQTCEFGDPLGQGQDRKDGDLGNKLHDGTGIRLGKSEPNLVDHRFTG